MSDRYGYIAIETLLNFCENSKDHTVTPNDFMRMARVQVPERKTGKWIHENTLKYFFCSECGEPSLTDDDRYIYSMDFQNFCPNCGADMRGKQDEWLNQQTGGD